VRFERSCDERGLDSVRGTATDFEWEVEEDARVCGESSRFMRESELDDDEVAVDMGICSKAVVNAGGG
jgi:hypothetical protein